MALGRDAAGLGRRLAMAPAPLRLACQSSADEQTQSCQAAERQQGETRLKHILGVQ
jgi:hypothetical protein